MDMDTKCVCGHKLEDHHNPNVCGGLVYEGEDNIKVMYDPAKHKKYSTASVNTLWYCLENRTDFPHAHGEECEYWGFNETGGLQPLDVTGHKLTWIKDPDSKHENSWILDRTIHSWEAHCRSFILAEEKT